MFEQLMQSDVATGNTSRVSVLREALKAAEYGDYGPMAKSGYFTKELRDAGYYESIAKAGEGVNYPLQGQAFGSGDLPGGQFAPLIPQAIDNVVTSITYDDKHLKIFKMIPKKSWGTTVYEYAQIVENGSEGLDGFVGEGAVGGLSEAKYRRAIAQVKYLTEKFSVTDVATMVTGALNGDLLSTRTTQATMNLLRKIEEAVVWGDSAVNPNQFDGILAQVRREAPDNYLDSAGARVDADRCQQLAAMIEDGPRWGSPDVMFCTSSHYRTLAQDLDLRGYAKFNETNKNFRLGADGIEFVTPFGKTVKVMALHFLDRGRKTPIPKSVGGTGAPAPILPTVSLNAGPVAGSKLLSSDLGRDHYFIFEIYGDEGTHVTATIGPVTPTLVTQAFQFDMADSAVPTEGANSIRYVRVFAASVASGATAPTASLFRPAGQYARNVANSGATRFNILYDIRPNTSPVIIAEWNPSILQMIEFLPIMRRPLPVPSALRQEMALLYFATPVVMQPNKMVIDMNVESAY